MPEQCTAAAGREKDEAQATMSSDRIIKEGMLQKKNEHKSYLSSSYAPRRFTLSETQLCYYSKAGELRVRQLACTVHWLTATVLHLS